MDEMKMNGDGVGITMLPLSVITLNDSLVNIDESCRKTAKVKGEGK